MSTGTTSAFNRWYLYWVVWYLWATAESLTQLNAFAKPRIFPPAEIALLRYNSWHSFGRRMWRRHQPPQIQRHRFAECSGFTSDFTLNHTLDGTSCSLLGVDWQEWAIDFPDFMRLMHAVHMTEKMSQMSVESLILQ